MSPPPLRSVTQRFLAIILVLFAFGTLIGLMANWVFAGAAADDAYDRLLISIDMQMIDSVERTDHGYIVNPPDSVFDTLRLAEEDRFFYAVRGPRGELLTGYPKLSAATSQPVEGIAKADARFLDASVRVITERRALGNESAGNWITATVAQTKETRRAEQLKLFARHAPITLSITAIGLLASLLAAKLAVRPLALIERSLARRDPQDLAPVGDEGLAETAPLVAAINSLMQRIDLRLAKLQQFAALAAHQLRTPLTALSAQVDLLAHEDDSEQRALRLERLRQRLDELNRLIHQLLGHAMIAYRGETAKRDRLDLVELSRSILLCGDFGALEKALELQFLHSHDRVWISGDPVMVREAIANLLNNAATHGARHLIKIGVMRDGSDAVISVADDGDGLSPESWHEAATPFALKRAGESGSGLGLSIVQAIATAHGGRIEFGRDAEGLFQVSIFFPEGEVE